MTAKDIQKNNENNTDAVDFTIPASGLSTQELIPESEETVSTQAKPQGKVTLGRKGRMANVADNARRGGRGGRGGSSGRRGSGENRERVKPEFDSKIIDIRRVTRVTAGGRRMNFSVSVVAGDRKGRVGVGMGKGIDTAVAVEKATREAKKNIIKIPLTAQMTIPHAVEAKYSSARIMIFPARGRGVVAGSSARAVIELAGIKDVCAKLLSGSKNRVNNAKAAIEALNKLAKIPRPNTQKK